MPVSDQYREFVLQQLEAVGNITCKSMFGGIGVYYETRFFAIVHNDALYFKVDDHNRHEFEAEGMGPFQPFPNKPATLQYYEVPIHVLEDASLLAAWTHKAIRAAQQAKKNRVVIKKKAAVKKTNVKRK